MRKLMMAVGMAAVLVGVARAAVTDYAWKFEATNRAELITEPAVGSKTVAAPWACPSWVEAYCEGGIFRHGLLLLFK